jgi:hypothetical protein
MEPSNWIAVMSNTSIYAQTAACVARRGVAALQSYVSLISAD